MPQIFNVLRCFKCSVFQVHQTKKLNKFQCKLCGEKQSIKRHYGIGTAKDCRIHVQKLNGIRQDIDEINSSKNSYSDQEDISMNEEKPKPILPKKSKWSDYVDSNNEISKENSQLECNETMILGDREVVLEVPKKKFRRPPPSRKADIVCSNKVNVHDTHTEDLFFNTNSNMTSTEVTVNDLCVTNKKHLLVIKEANLIEQKTLQSKSKDILDLKEKLPKSNACRAANQNCESSRLSRWAQFVDDKIDNVEIDEKSTTSQNDIIEKDINTLFSLTENEDDINALLDF